MENYMCPVCGYPDLDEPPYDLLTNLPSFNICPCCGCEFGNNDATSFAKEKFLMNWIKQGTPWFKPNLKPPTWDVKIQLKKINVDFDSLKKLSA